MSPASSQNCKFNVSRRNILLAGIILAASALATGTLTNVAHRRSSNRRCRQANAPTSFSSWLTMSAGSMSASTIRA